MTKRPYKRDASLEPCSYDAEVCRIGYTLRIRLKSPLVCDDGYEACHIAGLNLMKVFFDAEEWTTRRCTCEAALTVIARLMNDPENMVCCLYAQNHGADIADEKAVIKALKGRQAAPLSTSQQVMLAQFRHLLEAIQSELHNQEWGESRAIASVLERIDHYDERLYSA